MSSAIEQLKRDLQDALDSQQKKSCELKKLRKDYDRLLTEINGHDDEDYEELIKQQEATIKMLDDKVKKLTERVDKAEEEQRRQQQTLDDERRNHDEEMRNMRAQTQEVRYRAQTQESQIQHERERMRDISSQHQANTGKVLIGGTVLGGVLTLLGTAWLFGGSGKKK